MTLYFFLCLTLRPQHLYEFLFQVKTITWDLGEIGNAESYGLFEKTLSQTTKGKILSINCKIDVRILV